MYLNPEIRVFAGKELLELTGPIQAASIDLSFQQVAQSGSQTEQQSLAADNADVLQLVNLKNYAGRGDL